MGFSGGGTNVLKPHKHSSAVQDGSPLNMNNVTEATLSAGDVIYSDGAALQRLAIGTPAQQIKVNAGATAPEYFTPVAAASTWTSLYSGTGLDETFDTGHLTDMADYRYFDVYMTFASSVKESLNLDFYNPDGVLYGSLGGKYGQSGQFLSVDYVQANTDDFQVTFNETINGGTETYQGWHLNLKINSFTGRRVNSSAEIWYAFGQRYTQETYSPAQTGGCFGTIANGTTTSTSLQLIQGIKMTSPTSAQYDGYVQIFGAGSAT